LHEFEAKNFRTDAEKTNVMVNKRSQIS